MPVTTRVIHVCYDNHLLKTTNRLKAASYNKYHHRCWKQRKDIAQYKNALGQVEINNLIPCKILRNVSVKYL